LILQLAVQGKLTQKWREENPDVEPAYSLLKKIRIKKEKLILKSKIKKEKPLPAIEENEISFELPKSWAWTRLNDVCEYIQRGKSPNYTDISKIPVISQKCVQWTGFDISKVKFISEESFEKYSEERILQVGDLLWNSTGDGTLGRVITYPGSDFDKVVADSHVTVVRGLKDFIIPDYLWVYSASPFIQNLVAGRVSGSTKQTELSTRTIRLIEFSFPPLEEQKAIVAVVNQLFAEVEQLEVLTKERIQMKADFVTAVLNQLTQAAEQDVASRWAFIQEQFGTFFTEKSTIKKLRESILQLAVQGKLTQQWRIAGRLSGVEVESASKLLEKIKAEKVELIKAGKIKKEKPLPEITKEEILYKLPYGWVWCRLEDLTSITGGVTKGKLHQKNLINTIYLRVANVQRGYLELDVMKDILVSKSDYDKYQLHQNDLLMIEGGDPDKVGRCAIWSNEIPGCIYQNHVFRMRPYLNSTMNNHFFMLFINSRVTRDYYESCAKRTTNLASINKTQMRSTPIGFPPLEEQKAIVQKVNGLMALCDQLEQEIENHQTTQEQWMQSCLR